MRFDMNPPTTWWKAMPLVVRAAIWFTALCVLVPVAFIALALGAAIIVGAA